MVLLFVVVELVLLVRERLEIGNFCFFSPKGRQGGEGLLTLLLALAAPEAMGGMGGTMVDLALVAEALATTARSAATASVSIVDRTIVEAIAVRRRGTL